mmetsp:Transcript_5423/g.13050  ORF Transcript_5423/g.13050 Transcript_5423/m.13050 type:complete len:233 (+) Transcript_5423:2478-3176(+)
MIWPWLYSATSETDPDRIESSTLRTLWWSWSSSSCSMTTLFTLAVIFPPTAYFFSGFSVGASAFFVEGVSGMSVMCRYPTNPGPSATTSRLGWTLTTRPSISFPTTIFFSISSRVWVGGCSFFDFAGFSTLLTWVTGKWEVSETFPHTTLEPETTPRFFFFFERSSFSLPMWLYTNPLTLLEVIRTCSSLTSSTLPSNFFGASLADCLEEDFFLELFFMAANATTSSGFSDK